MVKRPRCPTKSGEPWTKKGLSITGEGEATPRICRGYHVGLFHFEAFSEPHLLSAGHVA